MMKRLVKLLSVCITLIILFLVGLFAYIKVQYPAEKIKALVLEEVSKAFDRDISLEDASVSIFPLGFNLKNFEINQPKGSSFKAQKFVVIPEATLSVDLLSILQGVIKVNEVAVDNLQLHYEIRRNGNTSLDGLVSDNTPKTKTNQDTVLPFDVNLKSLDLNNFSIDYYDHLNGQSFSMADLNLETQLFVSKDLGELSLGGALKVNQIQFSDKNSGIKKGSIKLGVDYAFSGDLKNGSITIEKLDAQLQKISVSVKGNLTSLKSKSPQVDVAIVTNEIKLDQLLKEIPQGIHSEIEALSAQGTAKVNLQVKGYVKEGVLPPLVGSVELNGIGIAHQSVPAKLTNLNGTLLLTQTSVEIKKISLLFAQQPVKVDGLVEGLPNNPLIKHFTTDAKLDLASIQTLGEKIISWPKGLDLKGMIQASVKASGKVNIDNPASTKVEGLVSLNQVQIVSELLKEKLKINGSVQLNSSLIKPKLKVKAGREDVSVDLSVKDPLAFVFPNMKSNKKTFIEFAINSNRLNLDNLLKDSDSDTEQSELPTSNPKIPDVRAKGSVNLKKTVFQNLKLTNFKMNVQLDNQVVSTNFTGDLYGGTISQTSVADMKNSDNAKITSKVNLRGVDANPFINDYNDQLGKSIPLGASLSKLDNTIFGKVNASVDLTSNGVPATFFENAQANVNTTFSNGQIKNGVFVEAINKGYQTLKKIGYQSKALSSGGVSFSNLVAKMSLSNGSLQVKTLNVKNTVFGDLDIRGSIKNNGNVRLQSSNLLNNKDSKKIESNKKAVLAFPFVNNRAAVYMEMGGQINKPTVSVDFSRMAKNAKGTQIAKKKVGEAKAKVKKTINKKKKSLQKKVKKDVKSKLKGLFN